VRLGFDVVLFQRLDTQVLLENGACSNGNKADGQSKRRVSVTSTRQRDARMGASLGFPSLALCYVLPDPR
jgi:hypothetical protein